MIEDPLVSGAPRGSMLHRISALVPAVVRGGGLSYDDATQGRSRAGRLRKRAPAALYLTGFRITATLPCKVAGSAL